MDLKSFFHTSSNIKRIISCRNVGKLKKMKGHEYEKFFLKQYNPNAKIQITYKPCSDTSIDVTHPIYTRLVNILKVNGNNVSNKSGKNIQVTLGKIPELEKIKTTNQLTEDIVKQIFKKYLMKSNSDIPANILAYVDDKTHEWVFFNIEDIVNFIAMHCIWRILPSGRIKGDFLDSSRKGFSQYITYEYRKTHKSFFLGFNGNKGIKFISLLKNNINFITDTINFEATK